MKQNFSRFKYEPNHHQIETTLQKPSGINRNHYFAEVLNKYFIKLKNVFFILGAGTSIERTPLWYQLKQDLVKYILHLPDHCFYGNSSSFSELKSELINFIPNNYHSLYDAFPRKIMETDEYIIRSLYEVLLFEGIKNQIKFPNYNPYSIFSFTDPASLFLNFNQDGLLHLTVDSNRIFEPHGSIIKTIHPILQKYSHPLLNQDLSISKYADLFDEIEKTQKEIMHSVSSYYGGLRNSSNRDLSTSVKNGLILPYDKELSTTNLSDSPTNFICTTRFPSQIEKEHANYLSFIRHENRFLGTWQQIVETINLSHFIVCIGYSFSGYDSTLIEILRGKLQNKKLIIIDYNAHSLCHRLSAEFKIKSIVPIELDWQDFVTTLKRKDFYRESYNNNF